MRKIQMALSSSYQQGMNFVSVIVAHTKKNSQFQFTIFLVVTTETINIAVLDVNDNVPQFEDDYSIIEASTVHMHWQPIILRHV